MALPVNLPLILVYDLIVSRVTSLNEKTHPHPPRTEAHALMSIRPQTARCFDVVERIGLQKEVGHMAGTQITDVFSGA